MTQCSLLGTHAVPPFASTEVIALKRAYLLFLIIVASLVIPIKGQSTEVPILRYSYYNYEITLENNSSYEAIIPFNIQGEGDLQIFINQSLGDGFLHAFFLSDETLSLTKIPSNATFIYQIDGTSYYKQPNGEIIAYRELSVTEEGLNSFIVTTGWSHLRELNLPPEWKMVLHYNGTETAKFNLYLGDPGTVDIINYMELSLNTSIPTIMDFVDRRVPMNLSVGLVDEAGLNSNLTVVWTTKNVTSEMVPEDFMTNPFPYDGINSKNSVAYNDSTGLSLVRTINLTKEGEKVFLDHPFFFILGFYKNPYQQLYDSINWTTRLDATPFHLLFYAEEPATIWIKLTKFVSNGFPILLVSSQPNSSTAQESPFLSSGMVLALFTAASANIIIKRKQNLFFTN